MNFYDYDKITDVIMYLDRNNTLNITTQLKTFSSKTNKDYGFHTEYKYFNKEKDRDCFNIKRDIKVLSDNWTVVTVDKMPAAHYEESIVITDNGYEILTQNFKGEQ